MKHPPAAYLRQPTIAGDLIAFVSDDDLWRVSSAGGVAVRLSAGLSEPATPVLSPDGQWLAYAGRDEQHNEVWLMPACGGPARRLTWLGSDLAVRGFTPEGRIVFSTNHGQPFFRHWHAWTVGVEAGAEGGAPQRLPLGAADHLAFGPGGRRAIGRNTGDPARWKRYRGGRAGALWVSAGEGAPFQRLNALQGNVTCPMWIGSRLYFIGDHEGVGNLYSCAADGSELRRHSAHRDFYARHAASDGRRIVYQAGGDLWLLDPAEGDGASPRRLEVQVASARTQAARRFVSAGEFLQGAQLHPRGHSLALEVRGQIHTMALWEGAVQRLAPEAPEGSEAGDGLTAGGRQRLGQWLADGRTLVAVSDRSGEERLVSAAAGAATCRVHAGDIGRATALVAAPHGPRVAITNHRNELLLADLEAGTLQVLDRSDFGRIETPAWSPCGGWLAYTYPTSGRHTAIKLAELASGRTVLASEPQFRDYAPAFDPAARYLYFLSLRTYDPVYDSVQFELSFPRAARPYLVALQAGGRPPFDPAPRAPGDDGRSNEGKDRKKPAAGAAEEAASPPAPTRIDLQGLARRVAAFPVAEGRFAQVAGLAEDKVAWTQMPVAGAHGRGGHKEGPGRLEVFDFATGRAHTVCAAVDEFRVAADHRSLLVRAGQRLRVLDAVDAEPDEGGEAAPAGGAEGASRESGWLDLTRPRIAIDPPREWAQMLREVWRLQRDHFWVDDMSGVAWPAVYERYAALLPRIATRAELSDLIWELQGELGTSHAYEMGGDHRKPPAVALGHLAAELRCRLGAAGNAEWEIVRTVQGDPWDAAADSPLNAVGVEAQSGERIVAVGGQPVAASAPPAALLVHQAGMRMALTLRSADGQRERQVTVALLADEAPARYREWVERNRAHVHAASGGRVGYLHLPDMMSAGFAEFHRYFATECDREALVVDVRFNRGGHVSQLLLEKVARRRIGGDVMRWGQPEPYPNEAPAGPVVALTNEHAGSDGDIFSHSFKLMGIGTLVGRRTWGGVIGIWPRHKLVDGTETTQPEYSFWFRDVGFGVENHGTDPQVDVDNAPEDDVFNAPERDRQLATALAEALKAADAAGPPPRPPHERPWLGAPRG